jgi:predicted enzyme related to lactoylglutathione lyase
MATVSLGIKAVVTVPDTGGAPSRDRHDLSSDHEESRSMSSTHFGFTKLLVTDLEAAAEFYTAVFGLKENYRVHSDIADRVLDEILFEAAAPGTATFVLLKFEGVTRPSSDEVINGFITSDLDALVQRALDAGGAVAREPVEQAQHGVKVAFITDIEGHMIEVVEPLQKAP